MTHRATFLLAGLLAAAPTATAGDVPGPGEVGGPIGPLDPATMAQWLRGREVFDRDFTADTGLGVPDFNANSCRACHQDPVLGGAGGLELNVSRFGRDNGGLGPFEDLPGGQGLSKLRPPTDDSRENYPPEADVFEQRQTPSLLGGGLIDGIPEEAILANEDPDDVDRDGIRGVARIVMVNGRPEVGRFGWKAQIPRLRDFVHDAMANECGITTPDEGRGFSLVADGDAVPDPELSPDELDDLDVFLSLLGPPPAGEPGADLARGAYLFEALRCARCHVPELPGADGEPVRLFSDLLLHDVMEPSFRGMEEPGAPAGVYRTPPLWGVSHTAPYMHDGRAESLRQAIEMHAGEAAFSSTTFGALSEGAKQELLAFLESI